MRKTPIILTAGILLGITGLGGCAFEGDKDSTVTSDFFDFFSPPTPSETARDAFNVYDADKRRRSVNLLAASYFGMEEPYVRTYRLLIDDSDPAVRSACVKALGMHGNVEDAITIAEQLDDESAFVRWEAAKALQRIHNTQVIDPLRRTLSSDEDADVRMAAATALGQYPTSAVFDSLVGVLTDANFGVALAARRSLETLTGENLGAEPTDWMGWAQDHRSTLFASQQPYVYYPYDKPPGTFQKMKFWNNKQRPPVEPRTPVGLEAAATHNSDAS